jgi:ankyrin repeat protein
MYAAHFAQVDICRLLVAAGADPYYCLPNAESALSHAAKSAPGKETPILLALGLTASQSDDEQHKNAARAKNVALLSFLATGSVSASRLLMDSGADVNFVSNDSWTPLLVAARRNEVECCKLLIGRGADPSLGARCAGEAFLTPFQAAVEAGASNVVAHFLNELGEDRDQRTRCGRAMDELASGHAPVLALLNSYRSVEVIEAALDCTCCATAADDNDTGRASAAVSRSSRSPEIL